MKIPFPLLMLKAYRAQQAKIRPNMAEHGLSPGQPKILSMLLLQGPCRQKDLAALCDIDPGTVSRLLNSMQKEGMITRTEEEADRRVTKIEITEKGRALHAAHQQYRNEVEQMALAGFSEEEKERFAAYLCRMYENLTGRLLER